MRKQKIIGAILCAIAFIFASGETIMNGVLAIAFLLPGVIILMLASADEEYAKNENIHSENLSEIEDKKLTAA